MSDSRPEGDARPPRRGRAVPVRWAAWGDRPHVLNQLIRYEPVVRLISQRGGRSLLDVGSGSEGVGQWLGPRWLVTAVDSTFDDYGGASGPARAIKRPVLADAAMLPFNDRSFDVVVSLDLIEHVLPARRSAVLLELARVTMGSLIVGCPTGPAAAALDQRFFEYLTKTGPGAPGWLIEHVEHGLPSRSDIVSILERFGPVGVMGNSNISAMERIIFSEVKDGWSRLASHTARLLAGAAREVRPSVVARGILRHLRGLDRPPVYRTIAVMDRRRGSGI